MIPWESLPKTFKDACTVCTYLGVSYIWIDSLCIVQDDPVEWEEESAVMGQIYEEALLTIAASSAVDSTRGLFDVRDKLEFVRIPYNIPAKVEDGTIHVYAEPEYFKIDDAPLHLRTRAWGASRRCIYLSTKLMIK